MKIQLIGGPYEGRFIKDRRTIQIKMGISKKWINNRPSVGSESGFAIYEPTENRKEAFWLYNVWDGITQKTINL